MLHALLDPILANLAPVVVSTISGLVVAALVYLCVHLHVQISATRQQQVRQAVADAVASAYHYLTKDGETAVNQEQLKSVAIGELQAAGIGIARDIASQKIESFLGHGKLAATVAPILQGLAPPAPGDLPKV